MATLSDAERGKSWTARFFFWFFFFLRATHRNEEVSSDSSIRIQSLETFVLFMEAST